MVNKDDLVRKLCELSSKPAKEVKHAIQQVRRVRKAAKSKGNDIVELCKVLGLDQASETVIINWIADNSKTHSAVSQKDPIMPKDRSQDNILLPHLRYPDTEFGRSVSSEDSFWLDRGAVAMYVANNPQLVGENAHLFLTNGAHPFYLFLALVLKGQKVSIMTNNLGIAGEYTSSSGNITEMHIISSGKIDPQAGAIFDLDKEEIRKKIENSYIFAEADVINPSLGPSAQHQKAEILEIAFDSGCALTLLCNYQNLYHCIPNDSKSDVHASMFSDSKKWKEHLKRTNFRIITTRHPAIEDDEIHKKPNERKPLSAFEKPHTWQLYVYNARKLSEQMGDRFIEIPSPEES